MKLKALKTKTPNFRKIQAIKPAPEWQMTKYFNFYINDVRPKVQQIMIMNASHVHGMEHMDSVVFRGIDYALHMAKDPIPVIFACACHDIARTNDFEDMEHGVNAVPLTIKILKQFPNLFDARVCSGIYYAIAEHTNDKPVVAPDYISACLWDSDRTRMSWKYGFKPEFFNTERGKYVAQHWKQYIDYQKSLFPHIKWSKEY